MRHLTTLLLLFICARARNHFDVDPLKTIVWGPGLSPTEITMRARYFFLQLVDLDGRKLMFNYIHIYFFLHIYFLYIFIQ